MVETIAARIVFDDKAIRGAMPGVAPQKGLIEGATKGFSDAIAKTAFAQDSPFWGDIAAGIGGIVLLLRAVHDVAKAAFRKLVEASPHLQATMALVNKTLNITLRPIGDTISLFLRPFVIAWMRFVLPIYKQWRKWFGAGGGKEAREEIGTGFKRAIGGLLEVDFGEMFAGFKDVFLGFIKLFATFGSEVLGPQFEIAVDWWKRAQEKFNTSGIFDTIGTILKDIFLSAVNLFVEAFGLTDKAFENIGEILQSVFGKAWTTFTDLISGLTDTDIQPFIDTITGVWDKFTEFVQATPVKKWEMMLAGFALAVENVWGAIVEPMVQALIEKIDEYMPGFRDALATVFEEIPAGVEAAQGFFGRMLESAQEAGGWIKEKFLGIIGSIWTTIEKVFGSVVGAIGDNVLGAFAKTVEAMKFASEGVTSLIERLNAIPRSINTTQTITTVYRTVKAS